MFLFFSLILTVQPSDWEYPALINPDGTIQPREFTKEQKHIFDFLKKDILYYHTEISKIVPYLTHTGRVKNNTFTKEIRNFIETQPGRRNQHFVSESFVLNLKEGKLTSISFLKRRTRLSSKMESETVVRTISNDTTNESMTAIKLQIDTHTNYTDTKVPISRVFPISEIPYGADRLKLIRAYRTKVEETLRELDRIVERKMMNNHTTISNTLGDVEIE